MLLSTVALNTGRTFGGLLKVLCAATKRSYCGSEKAARQSKNTKRNQAQHRHSRHIHISSRKYLNHNVSSHFRLQQDFTTATSGTTMMNTESKVTLCEQIIDYRFKDPKLCLEALQTSGEPLLYYRDEAFSIKQNKRFAVLGDTMLKTHLCKIWINTKYSIGK